MPQTLCTMQQSLPDVDKQHRHTCSAPKSFTLVKQACKGHEGAVRPPP